MAKKFASQADTEDKQITFSEIGAGAYAYTAEGDPNSGVIVGDEAVMILDTQATPVMAQDVIRRIREVTDKPIKYVALSHYHAVRRVTAVRIAWISSSNCGRSESRSMFGPSTGA